MIHNPETSHIVTGLGSWKSELAGIDTIRIMIAVAIGRIDLEKEKKGGIREGSNEAEGRKEGRKKKGTRTVTLWESGRG